MSLRNEPHIAILPYTLRHEVFDLEAEVEELREIEARVRAHIAECVAGAEMCRDAVSYQRADDTDHRLHRVACDLQDEAKTLSWILLGEHLAPEDPAEEPTP